MSTHFRLVAALVAALCLGPAAVRAAPAELRVAQQYGLSYLPLMLMEARRLVEKHAARAGVPDAVVTWRTFSSGTVMNDALLAGDLDVASGGVGPFATLWSRTRGGLDVRGVCALNEMPLYLVTRRPEVKTVADFGPQDRIALPAVKVSPQAVALQMAVVQSFGDAQFARLDAQTVAMSHPDGMTALLSGVGGITAHFTSPPYQYEELARPGMHVVVDSYKLLGGPATTTVLWTTARFRAANPRLYAAFLDAFREASQSIRDDPAGAAALYVRMAKDPAGVAAIERMLRDPELAFGPVPRNVTKLVDFMARTGALRAAPASWKDLFFPDIHDLPGS